MIPTVGRIVHYTSPRDGQKGPLAALITAVSPHDQFYKGQPPPDSEENKYNVSLHIFDTSGQFDRVGVIWSKLPDAGCWNWPPRV